MVHAQRYRARAACATRPARRGLRDGEPDAPAARARARVPARGPCEGGIARLEGELEAALLALHGAREVADGLQRVGNVAQARALDAQPVAVRLLRVAQAQCVAECELVILEALGVVFGRVPLVVAPMARLHERHVEVAPLLLGELLVARTLRELERPSVLGDALLPMAQMVVCVRHVARGDPLNVQSIHRRRERQAACTRTLKAAHGLGRVAKLQQRVALVQECLGATHDRRPIRGRLRLSSLLVRRAGALCASCARHGVPVHASPAVRDQTTTGSNWAGASILSRAGAALPPPLAQGSGLSLYYRIFS
jgi:hypothetical protein